MSHHLPIFGGHLSSVKVDINNLIFDLTSQDHVIEGSAEREPHMLSFQRVKFGGHEHYGSEDVMFSVCHVVC